MTWSRQMTFGILCLLVTLGGCVSEKISERTPSNAKDYRVFVKGGDTSSFHPPAMSQQIIEDPEEYDVIIMGGGLAGLSSAVYLTDAGKKVLLIEKEAQMGGLASWAETKDHLRIDRGAAYWTDTFEEELEILKHIGLGDFKQKRAIPEPIDSYFVRGKFYKGIWDEKTIPQLPASFALFKYELERAGIENKIPNQPFEEFEALNGKMELDKYTTRAWMEAMPTALIDFLKHPDEKATPERKALGKKILARFLKEKKFAKLKGSTGMEDVIELMDLYCRSALGDSSKSISAMAFANFYISEIETRYTSPQGTGIAADKMSQILMIRKNRDHVFNAHTSASVIQMETSHHGVEVTYNYNGQTHIAHAEFAVFASQLELAPKVIKNFKEDSPVQAGLMSAMGYSHYSVHLVYVEGQPYRATYDTWTRARDYSEEDFTDVILGDWMNPKMLGYEGYRDFKKSPPLKDGVLSIYQPLSQHWLNTDYNNSDAEGLARRAVSRLETLYGQLPRDLWQGPLKIKYVETNRWPLSVHIAEPGHYIQKARVLRKPYGRIFFAHNNLGTPAFEEALFRGHCAAVNILKRDDPNFEFEKWSRCPLED